MNRLEHFLDCLGEEGAEVAGRVSKALRFGLGEVEPHQPLTNAERIVDEIKDMIAVATILHDDFGAIGLFLPSPAEVAAKRAKIEAHMPIGIATGALVSPLDPGAIAALTDGQTQLDMHGEQVGVSRQALDELLAWHAAMVGL